MKTENKNIILAITGSIAAYKSAILTRLLVKKGYDVKVIMTSSATDFITPLTISTLSKNAVHSDISNGDQWNNHVDLGLWADLFVVAPATANTMAKMAHGIVDNMVLATYLSAKCPVMIAPAMDLDMWLHPSTKNNISLLQSYGNIIIDADFGELASGLIGKGRMAEPESILATIEDTLQKKKDLANKSIFITAGPTYEKIDPVRFIGNRSTGKMGIAVARAAADRGAKVILVLGPTSQTINHPSIQVINVQSASEMYKAAFKHYPSVDVGILTAAVADYTPLNYSDIKIKKKSGDLELQLARTKDIAKELGIIKTPQQLLIGFALETNNELENAKAKIIKKNFDFIVLNSLNDKGAGFGHDTNKISIIHKDNKTKNYQLKNKNDVAEDILDEVVSIIK